MRTTVTLDESLVNELMVYTRTKTKTAAVTQAVKEQIRRAKLKRLANQLGTIQIDDSAIVEGNQADLERFQWLSQIGIKSDTEQ
jgi:hypothetical protein